MRIGINCFSVNPSFRGGITAYTLGLLGGFQQTQRGHTFQLYVKNSNAHVFGQFASSPAFTIHEVPETRLRRLMRFAAFATLSPFIYRKVTEHVYNDVVRAMDQGSDVVYTPTTILYPYGFRRPTVLSMHDIQQFHYPQFFSRAELLNRKIHFSLSIQLTTMFQASSEFIKHDLLQHFPSVSERQIAVIREGVDIQAFSTPRPTGTLRSRYGIPEQFLFFPAQLWHHKNHLTVLRALVRLRNVNKRTIPLVLTGAKASAARDIFRFIRENNLDGVHYLGVVPFEDLVALYQNARALVTAVLYESSSLPVLEAAAAGTPVIASKTPPNLEIAQHLALTLFDPLDDAQLADCILQVWDDQTLAENHRRHNRKVIERFSWKNVAEQYCDLFEQLQE